MADDATPKGGKILDIKAPGPSTQATSRPVIVGHGAMIRDPMVSPAPKSSLINVKTPGAKITPPSSALAKQAAAEATKAQLQSAEEQAQSADPTTDAAVVQAEQAEPGTIVEATKSKSPQLVGKVIQPPGEKPAEAPAETDDVTVNSADATNGNAPAQPSNAAGQSSDAAAEVGPAVQTPNDQNGLGPNEPTKPTTELIGAVTPERMQELKSGKEFKISLHKSSSQTTSWLAVVIIVLMVIIGVGVALDAGWLDLGFKVPFDFIK